MSDDVNTNEQEADTNEHETDEHWADPCYVVETPDGEYKGHSGRKALARQLANDLDGEHRVRETSFDDVDYGPNVSNCITIGRNCPTCGAGPSFIIPIWEEPTGHAKGKSPDYLGCKECRTMQEVDDGE